MDNLFKVVIIDIIVAIFLIVLTIVTINKNHKDIKYILVVVGCLLVFFIFTISESYTVYKDVMNKETISFVGVYVSEDASIYNSPLGSVFRYFDIDNDGKDDVYFLDTFLNTGKYKPQKGKKYHVVVYKYSHTIYSLELVE